MEQTITKARIFSGQWWKQEVQETKALFRGFPAIVLSLFVLATILMNILAATQLVTIGTWFALDAGVFISFIMFLLGDMVVKRYGAKAAIKLSIFAMLINLIFCGVITGIAAIMEATGNSLLYLGDYVLHGFSLSAENFDGGVATAWHIILGSAAAFMVSAVINALVHATIRRCFKKNPNGLASHIASAWVSTAIGQFIDNLVFAFLVSIFLFGWTPLQVVMCALTGMVVELICQAIFTPIGFRVAESWRRRGAGNEYLSLLDEHNK